LRWKRGGKARVVFGIRWVEQLAKRASGSVGGVRFSDETRKESGDSRPSGISLWPSQDSAHVPQY